MAPTRSEVLDALRPVEDPELHQSIVDLGMVKSVEVSGGRVAVQVALTIAGCPLRTEITNRVTGAVPARPTPTATPRAGPSPSPTRRRAPASCSSPPARVAWASRRSR